MNIPIDELANLLKKAAKLGAMEALKYTEGAVISQRQADKMYGKKTIRQMVEKGNIFPLSYRKNNYTVKSYSVVEIEAAIASLQIALQIDSKVQAESIKMKGKQVIGIKGLARLYHCSYTQAKRIRQQLGDISVRQGRELVFDLEQVKEIVPIPKKLRRNPQIREAGRPDQLG